MARPYIPGGPLEQGIKGLEQGILEYGKNKRLDRQLDLERILKQQQIDQEKAKFDLEKQKYNSEYHPEFSSGVIGAAPSPLREGLQGMQLEQASPEARTKAAGGSLEELLKGKLFSLPQYKTGEEITDVNPAPENMNAYFNVDPKTNRLSPEDERKSGEILNNAPPGDKGPFLQSTFQEPDIEPKFEGGYRAKSKAEGDAIKNVLDEAFKNRGKTNNDSLSLTVQKLWDAYWSGAVGKEALGKLNLVATTTADRAAITAITQDISKQEQRKYDWNKFGAEKAVQEKNRQTGAIGQVLSGMGDDFRTRTKDIFEGKATIDAVLPDLMSLDSGRWETAQQRLASILNKGRPTESDYNKAGITGGLKNKLRAYFDALAHGNVPPDIAADRAAFFSSAEKVLNTQFSRESSSAISEVRGRLKAQGVDNSGLSNQQIIESIGGGRFNPGTPAASAEKDLRNKAKSLEVPKPTGGGSLRPGNIPRRYFKAEKPKGFSDTQLYTAARDKIRSGTPREAVIKQLETWGLDGSKLVE